MNVYRRGGQANLFFKSANSPNSFTFCPYAGDIFAKNRHTNFYNFLQNWVLHTLHEMILGLIPLLQICKFLWYASSQIANTAQLCLKTVLKVAFNTIVYYEQVLIRTVFAIFVRKKVRICGLEKVLSPKKQNKKLSPQITNTQSVTFAEEPQIKQIIIVRRFADLRFWELICGPPSFGRLYSLKFVATLCRLMVSQSFTSLLLESQSKSKFFACFGEIILNLSTASYSS